MLSLILAALVLTSSEITPAHPIPMAQVWNRDGCTGANRSPALAWHGAPRGTRSYALTVFDPDAGPHGWWHWAIADIPAHMHALTTDFAANASAGVVQGRNDFGRLGYGGPCPPPGPAHRYVFTLYALDRAAIVRPVTDGDAAYAARLRKHALASTTLVGRFRR